MHAVGGGMVVEGEGGGGHTCALAEPKVNADDLVKVVGQLKAGAAHGAANIQHAGGALRARDWGMWDVRGQGQRARSAGRNMETIVRRPRPYPRLSWP